MGGQRVCVFCGGGKLTIEDAFPKWIPRRLGVTGPATTSKAGTPLWHGKVLKVLIRAVCEDCNNGWMSRLENDVSRLIGDSMRNAPAPFALTDPQRETVGAWAVKTALMLELALATLRGSGLAPVSHFKWLYDHRSQPSPPPGCRVWLFGVDAKSRLAGSANAGVLESPRDDVPKAYLATFTAGYLGFQVFGPDAPANDSSGQSVDAPAIDPPATLHRVMQLVWPVASATTTWPPSQHINFEDLDLIAGWPIPVFARRA